MEHLVASIVNEERVDGEGRMVAGEGRKSLCADIATECEGQVLQLQQAARREEHVRIIQTDQPTGIQLHQVATRAAEQHDRIAAHSTAASDVDVNETAAAASNAHQGRICESLATIHRQVTEERSGVAFADADYTNVGNSRDS
jgi:hypothetical protein